MRRREAMISTAVAMCGGCLRLTTSETGSESEETSTGTKSSDTSTRTKSSDNQLELNQKWQAERRGDAILSTNYRSGSFYLGVYSRNQEDAILRMSGDGELEWLSENVPSTHTVYKSTSAVSDRHFIIGCQGESRTTFNPSANPDNFGGQIRTYEQESGNVNWTHETSKQSKVADIKTGTDDIVYVAVGDRSNEDIQPVIFAIDIPTGDILWEQAEYPRDDSNAYIKSLTTFEDQVLASTANGVVSFNKETGEVVNHQFNPNPGSIVSGRSAIYAVQYQYVSALEPVGLETIWETPIIEGVELPALLNSGTLYFSTREGHIYAISTDSGEIKWRKRTVARPRYITLSTDYLWISDTVGKLYAFSRSNGNLALESDAYIGDGGVITRTNPISATADTIFIGGTSRSLYSPNS